jgi:hypothetical protein
MIASGSAEDFSIAPISNTVSPSRSRTARAAATLSRATTTTMPMPQLNTRHISSSATAPVFCSHWNACGRGQAFLRITARVPRGSTRGTLPVTPPPVMCARPFTGTLSRSFSTGFT